jgi:hypothetical protein
VQNLGALVNLEESVMTGALPLLNAAYRRLEVCAELVKPLHLHVQREK